MAYGTVSVLSLSNIAALKPACFSAAQSTARRSWMPRCGSASAGRRCDEERNVDALPLNKYVGLKCSTAANATRIPRNMSHQGNLQEKARSGQVEALANSLPH